MEQDRVSYSFGTKESNGNFGSANVNFSYSTDVKPGESPEQAMTRAVSFVQQCANSFKTLQDAPESIKSNKTSQESSPTPKSDSKGLGGFIIRFGKKYNGKRLDQILPFELEDYVSFLTKEGEPKSKTVRDAVKAIYDYLDSMP